MGAIRNLDLNKWVQKYKTQVFFETGSGYGTGIFHSLQYPFQKILSVEIDKEQSDLLQKFFRFDQRVQIINGLSIDALKTVIPQIPLNIPIFFFLDAHFPYADLGKKGFGDEKDENIRMPLYQELLFIKENRIDKGAKDFILVDDIMLYDDDNEYESSSQKLTMDILPKENRNYLSKFLDLFSNSHDSEILTREQGYLILLPK
jgi:hypothetical protein